MQVFRHSAAHLLAAAVMELYPNVKLGIGPPIETGFFYEFVRDEPFTPDDLAKIEAKMHELASKDIPNERKLIPKPEAIELYRQQNQEFKCELVEEKADEPMVSFYTTGKFIDFCRGPHIPSTGRIKAFKLMSVAGAYWKGKESNPQMQRIYGACFVDQKELDEYLHRLEEAKKRDHRRIGKDLELFTVNDLVGAGLPLWLPKGATVRRLLEEYILEREREAGYQHVYTPDLAKVDLYKRSGHWEHYHEDMFPPMELETEDLVLRPMNCPHHILVYESKKRSYRDLPVRIAELGTMYRYERSGVLSGLSRVRCMTLNDAHIFCTPEQIKDEFTGVDALGRTGVPRSRHHAIQLSALAARQREYRKICRQRRNVGDGRKRSSRSHGFAGAALYGSSGRGSLLRTQAGHPTRRRDGPRRDLLHDPDRFPSAESIRPQLHRRGRPASIAR